MSATYRIKGLRFLRKYTARDQSPVSNTESEVAYLASHMCDVPWKRTSERDATSPWHTTDIVFVDESTDPPTQWSGLDYNVKIRDRFDAAMFCSDHIGGGHRVNANAAVYRFRLPDTAIGASAKTLQSIVMTAVSDPYNSIGARISLLTNSSGDIPTECPVCRNGGIWNSGTSSYDSSDTFHTPVTTGTDGVQRGVAVRTERTSGNSTSWFPTRTQITLNPSGFVLQRYLFVFVLLENYNVCRGNWVEGSSYIENSLDIVLDSSDSTLDGRVASGEKVLDLSADSDAVSGFDILDNSGFTSAVGSNRRYAVTECPLCGVREPERVRYSSLHATGGNAALWSSSSPSALAARFSGKIVGCSPLSLTYIAVITSPGQTLPSGTTSHMWSGGLIASYDYDPEVAGDLPGLSFYLALYATYVDQSAYDIISVTPSIADSSRIPTGARAMLASGSVKRIFVVPSFAWYDLDEVPADRSQMNRIAFLVVLASDTQTEILGYIVNTGYRTSAAVETGWKMYFLTNDDMFSEYGLVACSFPVIRLRSFSAANMKAYSRTQVTFDENAGTVTFQSAAELPSKVLFYAWRLVSENQIVSVVSNKAGVIECYGTNISIEPVGNFDAVEGQSAISMIVVSGNLERVGTTPCRNVAFVDMWPSDNGVETQGIVIVPEYDDIVTPVEYDDSFKVFPVQRTFNSEDPEFGIDAFVTSGIGIVVDSSVVNTAIVSGTTLFPAPQVLDSCLGFVLSSEKFQSFIIGFNSVFATLFSSTELDTLLLTNDGDSAAIGLRNCFGKMSDGELDLIPAPVSVNPRVNFTVEPTVRQMRITDDFGLTSTTKSFPVWRICSSYVLVPFVMPTGEGFRPYHVKFSWSSLANCTPGTVFNVWFAKGSRVIDDDSAFRDIRFYAPGTDRIDGWERLGILTAHGETSGEVDLPSGILPMCNTLLLTAWCPYDTYNPAAPLPTRLGVGTLDVDSRSGTVSSDETAGWLPSIRLTP